MRPVAVEDFCAVEAWATTATRLLRAARAGATARFCRGAQETVHKVQDRLRGVWPVVGLFLQGCTRLIGAPQNGNSACGSVWQQASLHVQVDIELDGLQCMQALLDSNQL